MKALHGVSRAETATDVKIPSLMVNDGKMKQIDV
jgi:hypothetical protein